MGPERADDGECQSSCAPHSPMTVFRVFYVSAVAMPHGSDDVQAILAVSRRNNWRLDITGCLLFSGSHFGQVFEGARPVVEVLAARIAADPRHGQVRVLSQSSSAPRHYNDWSMGYLHDMSLEDELARSLTDAEPDANRLIEVLNRMRPDTVMGPL